MQRPFNAGSGQDANLLLVLLEKLINDLCLVSVIRLSKKGFNPTLGEITRNEKKQPAARRLRSQ